MVKADVRRDYYADLGLQPSAEAEDIKKQFRKLALKYHPDRNQGREQDVIAKFQAIQAAHEILSDSQQRLKYDTERLRAGYGKVSGSSKAPPRKAQASYSQSYSTAAPPKPQGSRRSASYGGFPLGPNPQCDPHPSVLNATTSNMSLAPKPFSSSRTQGTSNGPSAGATRYATHARASPQSWQKPQDEAQTRADAFRGFHNMRGQPWRGFDPTSGATPRQQNAPFGNQKPKSAYEYFKENAQKNSTGTNANSPKKRHGYAPGTAGGDEPMAANTSAYTSTRNERPSSMYFDSVPAPTAKKPTVPVSPNWHSQSAGPPSPPLAQEFERTSRSYATKGGEKTFFTSRSPALGRSSTMRTPSTSYRSSNARTRPSSPDPAQPERHRSASPKTTRERPYSFSSTSSDLDDDTTEDEVRRPNGFKPMAVPKSRLRPNQKFTDFFPARDSSPGIGEEESTPPDIQGHRQSSSAQGNRKPRQVPTFIDLTADSEDGEGHNSDSAAFAQGPYRPEQQGSNSSTNSTRSTQNPTNPSASARKDPSNLHKKFSAEDWRVHLDEFDFLGASLKEKDPLGRAGSANPNTRPRASTRVSPTQSSTSAGVSGSNTFGSTSRAGSFEPQSQKAPTPFAQAKFSADKWSKDLHNISWTAAEKSGQSDSTSSSRSPKKASRSGTKVRSTPKPARVASEVEEAEETVNVDSLPEHHSSMPAGEEPMDIDDELPSMPSATAPSAAVPGPAEVPIGSARTTKYPDLSAYTAHGTHPAAPQPPVQKERVASQNGVRSPLFDLGNFGNLAPFASTNSGGIENLGDVSATLPFESRAKSHATTKDDIRPRALQLPNPPKRPKTPVPIPMAPGSQKLVLSRDQWNWYVSAMGAYMHEWNTFNRRMLLHFNTRQDAIETGLAPGWISAVGDTTRLKINGVDEDGNSDQNGSRDGPLSTEMDEYLVPGSGKGGYSAYLRGIEEDIKVRKHWEVACELHRDCILELGRLREWIRNGGKVV